MKSEYVRGLDREVIRLANQPADRPMRHHDAFRFSRRSGGVEDVRRASRRQKPGGRGGNAPGLHAFIPHEPAIAPPQRLPLFGLFRIDRHIRPPRRENPQCSRDKRCRPDRSDSDVNTWPHAACAKLSRDPYRLPVQLGICPSRAAIDYGRSVRRAGYLPLEDLRQRELRGKRRRHPPAPDEPLPFLGGIGMIAGG